LVLGLRRSEAQVLARLLTHDCNTVEELHAAANHNNQTVAPATMSALICVLRRKLDAHDITITTIRNLGYGLPTKSRERLRKLLAKYDAGVIRTTPIDAAPPRQARKRRQPITSEPMKAHVKGFTDLKPP
jgi:hypothetical protein